MCKGLYKNSCINRANIIPISDAHRLANTQPKCNTYYLLQGFKLAMELTGLFYDSNKDNK